MDNVTEAMENLDNILAQINTSEIRKFETSKRQNGCLSEAVQSTVDKIDDGWDAVETQFTDVKAYCEETDRKFERMKELKTDTEEELANQKMLLEGYEKVEKVLQ